MPSINQTGCKEARGGGVNFNGKRKCVVHQGDVKRSCPPELSCWYGNEQKISKRPISKKRGVKRGGKFRGRRMGGGAGGPESHLKFLIIGGGKVPASKLSGSVVLALR